MTREEWLQIAAERMRPWISKHGTPCPPIHVSIGWPSKGALSKRRSVIGQCWSGTVSSDGTAHIFVSPKITSLHEIMSTLLHEMIHATVGTTCGHKGEFIRLAKLVGFTKPWTSTPESLDLTSAIDHARQEIESSEVVFPNLIPGERDKPQTTRYRLYECECPKKIRHAGDDLSAHCYDCDSDFVLKVKP